MDFDVVLGNPPYGKGGNLALKFLNSAGNRIKSDGIVLQVLPQSIRSDTLQNKIKQDLFISVLKGKIFDVIVDLRPNSKTFGKYLTNILSEKNSTSLFVPSGFAHGFCALEKENLVLYGITNYRSKNNELGILWKDKELNIKWPIKRPIISKKDKKNLTLKKYKNLYL